VIRLAVLTLTPVAAVAVAVAVAQAQSGPPAKTARALEALVAAGAPGAEVLIEDGSSTSVLLSGFANPQTKEQVRAIDHFRVGSITKSFVATVVLQLVAEGKLSLADTVEQRLPGLVPRGNGITIRELLQHTSGLYDYASDARVSEPYLLGNLGYSWTPRQLVAFAVSHKPLFRPGARWSYSSTNYLLLGLIVEAVTKDTLGNELRRRIILPLGLRQTSFEVGRHIAAPAAHGFYNGIDVTTLSGSPYWAAGAIVSTAADVARFYRALLGGKLLRPQQLKSMETTVNAGASDYGLGLEETSTPCGKAWGHDGLVPGYTSFARSSKDGRHQIVVLSTSTTLPSGRKVQVALDKLVVTAFCD
jgi:D-alanyl-D-alanine carboxypeptidase